MAFHPLTLMTQLITFPNLFRRFALGRSLPCLSAITCLAKTSIKGGMIWSTCGSSSPGRGK